MTAGDDGHDYIHDDNHPFSSPEPALSRVALGTRMDDGTDSSVSVNKGRFSISGSAVNGTRFVGSSHWKIPRKSGKSKKVVPFSRLKFPNGMSCSIYVSRSLYQFQVHGRAPPRTGVYDQMEQLFTNRKFHFCYHRNFRVFFLNGKRPRGSYHLHKPTGWKFEHKN